MMFCGLFRSLFDSAVSAARPEDILPAALPPVPKGRTVVIGAGKGAAHLAQAFERLWPHPLEGMVVTCYGCTIPTERLAVCEASHPLPDAAGLAAAEQLKTLVSGLGKHDLVVALICGGGSALLPSPPSGITLADEIALQEALLASGLTIGEMNSIRAVFSTIKAGRLAALAAPAKVWSLIVSDVPGDDPGLIASGPTVPRSGHAEAARRVLGTQKVVLPSAMQEYFDAGEWTIPDPQDEVFADQHYQIIASAQRSLEAAADYARAQGYRVTVLSDCLEGEAVVLAREHGQRIRTLQEKGMRRHLLLSGGECTVTHQGSAGRGGPNSEYVLALAQEIAGLERVAVFAADTDGFDGIGDHAGAWADGNTMARLRAAGVDLADTLARHDSATALATIDALFCPGHTGTNVNDFRVLLLE